MRLYRESPHAPFCRVHLIVLAAVLSFQPHASAQNEFLNWMFHHDVEVIAVTDMTDAGRKLRHPSRASPTYYEALVLGYTDFGRTVAGLDVPDKNQMLKLILKLLADQGYFPATVRHPPEILLAFAWGTMNERPGMALPFMGGDKADVLWELEPLSIGNSARALTRGMRSQVATFLVQCSDEDLYVISIQAFDEELAKHGKTELLWHTKVSCPALGLGMRAALKQMARQAAPYFGRETAMPVWKTAPVRDGRVDLGELKVLETIDPKKLPITEMTDEPASPSR